MCARVCERCPIQTWEEWVDTGSGRLPLLPESLSPSLFVLSTQFTREKPFFNGTWEARRSAGCVQG